MGDEDTKVCFDMPVVVICTTPFVVITVVAGVPEIFCVCEVLGSITTYLTIGVGCEHDESPAHLSVPKPETSLHEFAIHVLKQHFLPSGIEPSE